MEIEQKIHSILMDHPIIKRKVKRIYQRINVAIGKPKKSEGDIVCVSPKDNYDYFFGYYDKSPWDTTNRYMLCMKANDTSKEVSPNEKLDILLIDTKNNNKPKKIAESNSWNVQQGCMAQWLGPSFDKKIIYNDFRNGKYCSIILDVFSGDERIINMPIYSVSSDGKFALTLDFSRLHRLRPGYGYSNLKDKTENEKIPNSPCIWKIDLEKNVSKPYLYYKDFYNFETRKEMESADHKVNHIMISPNNDKFMVIHRWFVGNKKYSRLVTCDIKTKRMYNLSDDNMVSHCCWKNNDEVLGFLNKKSEGNGYYLMKDKTKEYDRLWNHIMSDGHPNYSSNNGLIVTDTYPNKKRICVLKVSNEITNVVVGRVFASFRYDNNTRCDLHPRWNRNSNEICFDSCHENRRALYTISVDNLKLPTTKIIGSKVHEKGKYKLLFVLNTCRRCGPTQVIFNIIKKLDFSMFDPIILTIEDERIDTNISDIYPYISKHYFVKTSKKDILLGKTKKLEKVLNEINPDLIHSTGVFSDYVISKINKYKQVITMHNYVYDDYITKFGKIRGKLLAKMQLASVDRASKVVTCSKSLTEIYDKCLNLKFDYIQNGIDVNKYKKNNNRNLLRKKLNINSNSFVFIYTGQFIQRKNVDYILKGFSKVFKNDKSTYMILLGDGPELLKLKRKYSDYNNILFMGNVSNVEDYLSCSDVYISASKSEGLPNGVLEAMSCELPVLLSDIPQHLEVLTCCCECGFSFSNDDITELVNVMQIIRKEKEIKRLSVNAHKVVNSVFSDIVMSEKYQKLYLSLIEQGDSNEL